MFIVPNPPKKRGKKRGSKRRSSKRGKRKGAALSPRGRFTRGWMKRHKGSTIGQASAAYAASKVSGRWTTKARARLGAKRYISQTMCDPKKLQRAMTRFCKIRPKYKGDPFGKRRKSKRVLGGLFAPPARGMFGSTPGSAGLMAAAGLYTPKRKRRRSKRKKGESAAMRAWRAHPEATGGTSMDYGFSPIMGLNPFRRYNRRGTMKRRSRFGYRAKRHNPILGGILSALSVNPPVDVGILSGVKPRNLVGVLPILGGALLNGYVRGQLIPSLAFMPNFLKAGLGNYLLGVGTSGLLGAAVGYFDYGLGQSVFVGGVGETAISAFVEGWVKKSILAPLTPRMSGMDEDLEGCEGYGCGEDLEGLALGPSDTFRMGDFAAPVQTANALQMPSSAGQYPMPAPATVADYEQSVLADMIEDTF